LFDLSVIIGHTQIGFTHIIVGGRPVSHSLPDEQEDFSKVLSESNLTA
jgi:hypothetical protein